MCVITEQTVAYSHNLVQRRSMPTGLSIDDCYQRVVKAWREENIGLPWYVLPPFVRDGGDPITGVGLTVVRFPPPGALQERIISYKETQQDIDDTEASLSSSKTDTAVLTGKELVYKVMNPGWWTWPVSEHEGRIQCTSISKDTDTEIQLIWTVQWTPLNLPGVLAKTVMQRLLENALYSFTDAVIGRATDHIARRFDDDDNNNNPDTVKREL